MFSVLVMQDRLLKLKVLASLGCLCFFGDGPNTVSEIRFQTPNSLGILALTEFRVERSVSSSQPFACAPEHFGRTY